MVKPSAGAETEGATRQGWRPRGLTMAPVTGAAVSGGRGGGTEGGTRHGRRPRGLTVAPATGAAASGGRGRLRAASGRGGGLGLCRVRFFSSLNVSKAYKC